MSHIKQGVVLTEFVKIQTNETIFFYDKVLGRKIPMRRHPRAFLALRKLSLDQRADAPKDFSDLPMRTH